MICYIMFFHKIVLNDFDKEYGDKNYYKTHLIYLFIF